MNKNFINFEAVEKFRINIGPYRSEHGDDFGFFSIPHNRSQFIVMSSGYLKGDWYHVSISIKNEQRCPVWEEMCFIKDLFFGDNVAIQFHPKKEDYINNHPYCLHLWAPLKEEIKTPPKILVGI
jgi:hypothetical protein